MDDKPAPAPKTTNPDRSRLRRVAPALVLLVAGAAWSVPPAAAAPCTQDGCYADPNGGASQLDTELAGQTFYGPHDEAVDVVAGIHLVARPRHEDGSRTVHLNVASATARGVESDQRYAFTGADSLAIPGNPVIPDGPPIRATAVFRMAPEGPPIRDGGLKAEGPPIRVSVTVELGFDAAGRLTAAAVDFDQVG